MKKTELYKKRIGVLMGGWSSERDISLKSGKMVADSLKRQGFQVVEIDVDRNIAFTLKKENIDIAFIMLHGTPGEDGIIQGILETLGIPYTGSGILASSISMNKIMTKKILESSGIPVPKYLYPCNLKFEISNSEFFKNPPWVIKPVSEGSSIGVHIVKNYATLEKIFHNVKENYGDVFIEEYINGTEITCGILCESALPLLELVPKREFYDYKAKYTKGLTEFIIPARLEEKIYKKAQEIALMTHKIIGCRGFSRVDMIVRNEVPYVLEINSIPGMTELSDLPAEAKHIGISYDEVVRRILEEAYDRNYSITKSKF